MNRTTSISASRVRAYGGLVGASVGVLEGPGSFDSRGSLWSPLSDLLDEEPVGASETWLLAR